MRMFVFVYVLMTHYQMTWFLTFPEAAVCDFCSQPGNLLANPASLTETTHKQKQYVIKY